MPATAEDQEEEEAPEEDSKAPRGKPSLDPKVHTIRMRLVWLSVCMLSAASVLGLLYYWQMQRVSDQIDAMKTIRDFVVNCNLSLERANDATVLAEVEGMAAVLVDYDIRMLALQADIDDAASKIANGWRAHNGSLFYIDPSPVMFRDALMDCRVRKLTLSNVTTPEEEAFLESIAHEFKVGVWIGLEKYAGQWKWTSGTNLRNGYWKQGSPGTYSVLRKECVEVETNCEKPGSCWGDIACDEKRLAVCRMYGDTNWLT